MQRLEVSGAVRLIYKSLGVKGLRCWNVTSCIAEQGYQSFDQTATSIFITRNMISPEEDEEEEEEDSRFLINKPLWKCTQPHGVTSQKVAILSCV